MIVDLWQYFLLEPFKNLLDIATVSVIYFSLFSLIRPTQTRAVFRIIFFLSLIVFMAFALRLETVIAIFREFWSVSVVILCIVFQPEIRNALLQMGEAKRMMGLISRRRPIEEVSKAVYRLSRKGLGALIVLEGEDDLTPRIESGNGIFIEGVVSVDLLVSIFEKESPLHDGATIIRNNRVVAAGVVLELLMDVEVPQGLGTRHRAALSISRLTDAIAIVVSEETGSVRIARGGRLSQPIVERDELEARLVSLWGA